MSPAVTPLRYAVLRHDGIPDPHFDLMFEFEPGAPLRTWRSPVWPITGRTRLVPLEPHRPAYLDYEGPVSGGRGHVRRVAGGTFTLRTPDAATREIELTGGPVEGLLLRTWVDSHGQTLWDVTAM